MPPHRPARRARHPSRARHGATPASAATGRLRTDDILWGHGKTARSNPRRFDSYGRSPRLHRRKWSANGGRAILVPCAAGSPGGVVPLGIREIDRRTGRLSHAGARIRPARPFALLLAPVTQHDVALFRFPRRVDFLVAE